MKASTRLRELLAGDEILVAPGAYDSLSARLVESAGFDAVYLTGFGISASMLGKPDLGLITMTEMATCARNVVGAVSIPAICDADTGYGNPLNVMRTVEEFERAGVAAIHIEDQVWPKRCGHFAGKRVIPKTEMIKKIEAAVEARTDTDFVIIARTDAIATDGLDEAIERGNAYAEAGADVIFLDAPTSLEDVALIAKRIEAPLLINMAEGGRTPQMSVKELEGLGYDIVIFPALALVAAVASILDRLEWLKSTGTTAGAPPSPAGLGTFAQVIGLADYMELDRRFTAEDRR